MGQYIQHLNTAASTNHALRSPCRQVVGEVVLEMVVLR
jgi:hypothetical protein